ncbi:MAG TPA: hypothetical protein VGI40_13725 [Pirellulaceae bacterium]|jgi:hypothetical protein
MSTTQTFRDAVSNLRAYIASKGATRQERANCIAQELENIQQPDRLFDEYRLGELIEDLAAIDKEFGARKIQAKP